MEWFSRARNCRAFWETRKIVFGSFMGPNSFRDFWETHTWPEHCVLFLGKTLSQCLPPPRCKKMGTDEFIDGGGGGGGGLASHLGRSWNTPSRLMLLKPEYAPAWWATCLDSRFSDSRFSAFKFPGVEYVGKVWVRAHNGKDSPAGNGNIIKFYSFWSSSSI